MPFFHPRLRFRATNLSAESRSYRSLSVKILHKHPTISISQTTLLRNEPAYGSIAHPAKLPRYLQQQSNEASGNTVAVCPTASERGPYKHGVRMPLWVMITPKNISPSQLELVGFAPQVGTTTFRHETRRTFASLFPFSFDQLVADEPCGPRLANPGL